MFGLCFVMLMSFLFCNDLVEEERAGFLYFNYVQISCGFFMVAKISNIFLGCLKFLIFFWG